MKYDLIVVGAGASGLCSAITFMRGKPNSKVLVLEKNSRVCRKLSASGNGLGNIANININSKFFHSCSTEELNGLLNSKANVLDFLRSLGLTLRQDGERIYPYSYQATAVTDALLHECNRLGVQIKTDCEVVSIDVDPSGKGFSIQANEAFKCQYLIFAVGGMAWRGMRSYPILARLGYRVTPVYPSLVQLRADISAFKGLRGVKVTCEVSTEGTKSMGDVLFTEYGFSGNAVFAVSGYVSRQLASRGEAEIFIDFMPDLSIEQVKAALLNAKGNSENTLLGLFHKHLTSAILRLAEVNCVGLDTVDKIASVIKNCRVRVLGTNGFDNAQVTIGGVELNQFDNSLMSKLHRGLFCVGEVLDVDGDCGGYNLYFAWLSGIIAGNAVVKLCE